MKKKPLKVKVGEIVNGEDENSTKLEKYSSKCEPFSKVELTIRIMPVPSRIKRSKFWQKKLSGK